MHTIECTLNRIWPKLTRGEKVDVPVFEVEHPADRPDLFRPPPGALPTGQTCDYVWRLEDGGRVHAQCFQVGALPTVRFHVDRFDPERSPADWLAHALFETPLVPALAVAGLALIVVSQIKP